MKNKIWMGLVYIVVAAGWANAQCSLQLTAVDSFGTKIPIYGTEVSLHNLYESTTQRVLLDNSQNLEIPCGSYLISLSTKLLSSKTQAVTLPGPNGLRKQEIVFGLKLYEKGDRQNPHVIVRLESHSKRPDDKLSYSLIPVFVGEPIVQRALRADVTVFQHVPPGRYLMLIEQVGMPPLVEDVGEIREGYSRSVSLGAEGDLKLTVAASDIGGDVLVREQ